MGEGVPDRGFEADAARGKGGPRGRRFEGCAGVGNEMRGVRGNGQNAMRGRVEGVIEAGMKGCGVIDGLGKEKGSWVGGVMTSA